ncbi:MmpS family transport accessory protein [Mycobacterium asiaticum]|uniref:MmpS family transport accessory protein n=1 Tax=Mycobacterium asiaticum TaxID=1790 RepID=UPI0007EF6477|nr:MmpS family transport accessory protein [Mycobacterium asiaticum]OBI91985.1 hypothetical protein A5661_26705 [Mycobacterium asiaticum]
MSKGGTPILRILKRAWVPLVVVAAVALGGLGVERLRGVFGSDNIFSATGNNAEPLVPFNPKQVTYEVFGPGDTQGSVSYLNSNAQPKEASFTSLPWTYTITTTIPAVIANVVAQGNSDSIGCRITVNGEIKDQRSAAGHHAQTFCLVKAA